jgi:hypothetical protein
MGFPADELIGLGVFFSGAKGVAELSDIERNQIKALVDWRNGACSAKAASAVRRTEHEAKPAKLRAALQLKKVADIKFGEALWDHQKRTLRVKQLETELVQERDLAEKAKLQAEEQKVAVAKGTEAVKVERTLEAATHGYGNGRGKREKTTSPTWEL